AALGVNRIILENDLRLHLDRLIDAQLLRHQIEPLEDPEEKTLLKELLGNIARHGVFGSAVRTVVDELKENPPDWLDAIRAHKPDLSDDLLAFLHDRLKVFLRDRGIRHDVIDACLAMPNRDDLTLLVKRASALTDVLGTDDGTNLIQGFKRANNILTQAETADGVEYSYGADPKFAEDATERALFAALDGAEAAIGPAMKAEDFEAAMAAMAGLRGPIDAFFEAVQVNTDNQIVRRNRLNLLARIRDICLSVADLTRIEG
ncbi:MAG: glycine--tRNA ligase subunit beta, partial [Maritimibacter sp.]|nr:glycine--tRNA ligase subunit beta [Maritimibacter sp.]